jgi:predicted dehydrogenase
MVLVAPDNVRTLTRLEHASGRVMRNPSAKVRRFLVSDGPAATWRKARTKLGEQSFHGDYHVSAVTGQAVGGGRVAALACRVPSNADFLPVHEGLVSPIDDSFVFDVFADRLAASTAALARIGRQRYLYSGESPSAQLVEYFAAAVAAGGGEMHVVERSAEGVRPNVVRRLRQSRGGRLPVALLGAGDYARTEIVPRLDGRFERHVVADREPQIAALAAETRGFAFATTDAFEAIDLMPQSGVVFVATNHDSHAALAAAALGAGHRVFLEKPPVVTHADLALLVEAIRDSGRMPEIGFNRRYNRLMVDVRRHLGGQPGPATVTSIVKEVALEPDHWYLWPNQGTRVTGNLCHWLDLGVFLVGGAATPTEVTASPAVNVARETADEERVVSVGFDDGSLVSVVATGRGDDIRGVQELVDARRGRVTATLDDLWKLTVRHDGVTRRDRTIFRDKGHGAMFAAATERLADGRQSPYPLRDLVIVSLIQIEASRLVRDGGTHASITESVIDVLGGATELEAVHT